MRSYGLSCDNLIAAEVVTADGNVVTTSENERPELLWGLRGGGGNFGVVTSFTYRLHPVGELLAGPLIHPVDRALEVFRFYREFTASAPDEVTVFAGLSTSPDGMPIVVLLTAYNGPVAEGERVLRPLREFGPPLADQIAPMPYTTLQSMLDEAFPPGMQVYWRSHFLRELSDDALETMIDRFSRAPSPLTGILIEQFGGAVARIGRDETAFDHRDAAYNLAIVGSWPDAGMNDAGIAWTRELWTALRPYARGVYVNYLGVGESASRVKDAFGEEKYSRLAVLKREYDPANLFRFNQNIPPAS